MTSPENPLPAAGDTWQAIAGELLVALKLAERLIDDGDRSLVRTSNVLIECQKAIAKAEALSQTAPMPVPAPVPAEPEPEQWWLNKYEHCGQQWEGQWSCCCNDDCPVCGKEIEPYESEEIDKQDD